MGVALLIVGVALMTLSIVQKPQEIQIPVNTSSPSYLMLSNWSNMSIYISTGYPIPKPILNGESSKPPGIVQVFYSNYGPLGINVTITNAGNTKAAYLALNNTVIIEEDYGETSIFTPPNYTSIVVIQRSTINTMIFINVFIPSTYSYEVVNRTYILITKPIPIGIYSGTNITIRSTSKGVILSTGGNYTYIILNLGSNEIMPISELININNHEVNNWLSLARKPRLNGAFLDEYYLSLLLIIDDQNPVTGEFVASPEPVYLYSWVRDSSFAAMALQSAGYYEQAMKYWLWMCNAQNVSGTWYTRYDFWSGAPDKTFGIPEYDSVGLFQIGIWQFYELTHNKTFLMEVMPCINKSLIWEENEIQNNGGLIPMDLSIWESNYAYNFWTQAIDDLGLYATAKIYRALGLNNTPIIKLANELNATIQKYFYSRNFYSQALMETTIYTSNGSETTYAPNGIPDSSVILPIAMGLISPRSRQAISTVNTVIRTLLING
ncbi:MAG: glycoside hydrolase family 15 protein, partial [Vulcanisaeta sp.]